MSETHVHRELRAGPGPWWDACSACVERNQRLEELEGAEARLRETGLHLLAYIDRGDLSGLQFDAIYKDFRAAITREEEE